MKNEEIIKSSLDPVSIFVPKDKNVKVIPSKTYNPLLEHSPKIIRGEDTKQIFGKGKVSIGHVPDIRMVGMNPSSYTPRVGGCMCEFPTRYM